MTNKDKQLLEHIIRHCNRVRDDIERFGNDDKAFISDPAFRDSVSMNILQIGELSSKLSDEFKQSTAKDIPWKRIYDMRNHFAHGYGTMDNSIIWKTAADDVPTLKRFCESCLNEKVNSDPNKSWISKQIDSAKFDSKENNKGHEPKNHNKDQSL